MSGPNPSGLCMCGCGEQTMIAPSNHRRYGWVKGEPTRFKVGHANRKSAVEYVIEDCGYASPCWVWQKAIGRLGYGNLWDGQTTRNAHRVYYERARGPIPTGLQLDHLCRNRACVNPDHLEPVTNRENSHRGIRRRLSTSDVEAIRNADPGRTNAVIAFEFGISPTYCGQIRLGKRRAAA